MATGILRVKPACKNARTAIDTFRPGEIAGIIGRVAARELAPQFRG